MNRPRYVVLNDCISMFAIVDVDAGTKVAYVPATGGPFGAKPGEDGSGAARWIAELLNEHEEMRVKVNGAVGDRKS